MQSDEERDAAAKEVLRRYEEEGLPFLLYLRDFGVLRTVSIEGYFAEPLFNTIVRELPPGSGIVHVQASWSLGETLGAPFAAGPAPALRLRQSAWKATVIGLIRKASVIVCDISLLNKGTSFELKEILRARQADKTVLLLPGLETPMLAALDRELIIRPFVRVCYMSDFQRVAFAEHPCVIGLVSRMKILAQNRSAKDDRGSDNLEEHTPPISYDGVGAWYCALAYTYELDLNSEASALTDPKHAFRSRQMAFWSYYRAVSAYECLPAERQTPEGVAERYIASVRIAEMARALRRETYATTRREQHAIGEIAFKASEALEPLVGFSFTDNRIARLRKTYRRFW